MEQLNDVLKTTLGEIERMLSTKTVVGEPFDVRGNTIVPLVAVGFGFGGGGGEGEDPKKVNARVMESRNKMGDRGQRLEQSCLHRCGRLAGDADDVARVRHSSVPLLQQEPGAGSSQEPR
jgi:hypothetical protein